MESKIRFALYAASSLLVAWVIVYTTFYHYVLKPIPSQRNDPGDNYATNALPFMVCEYQASNGRPHTERFVNCQAAKRLNGIGSKHIYGLVNE